MEEFLTQPDEPYLPDAMQNYARAIEKTLAEVPVVNGIVDIEALWMELGLPRDLIIEVFQTMEIKLPPHVERVVGQGGQTLAQQKKPEPKEPAL
jgi:hypothetical protein